MIQLPCTFQFESSLGPFPYWTSICRKFQFCAPSIRDIFAIPKSASRMWLTVSAEALSIESASVELHQTVLGERILLWVDSCGKHRAMFLPRSLFEKITLDFGDNFYLTAHHRE